MMKPEGSRFFSTQADLTEIPLCADTVRRNQPDRNDLSGIFNDCEKMWSFCLNPETISSGKSVCKQNV